MLIINLFHSFPIEREIVSLIQVYIVQKSSAIFAKALWHIARGQAFDPTKLLSVPKKAA